LFCLLRPLRHNCRMRKITAIITSKITRPPPVSLPTSDWASAGEMNKKLNRKLRMSLMGRLHGSAAWLRRQHAKAWQHVEHRALNSGFHTEGRKVRPFALLDRGPTHHWTEVHRTLGG
jgi:hypothetical protein